MQYEVKLSSVILNVVDTYSLMVVISQGLLCSSPLLGSCSQFPLAADPNLTNSHPEGWSSRSSEHGHLRVHGIITQKIIICIIFHYSESLKSQLVLLFHEMRAESNVFWYCRRICTCIYGAMEKPPPQLICNNRTRLERCSSVKCPYFPYMLFVL